MEAIMIAGVLGTLVFFVLTLVAWMGRKGNSRKYFFATIFFFFLFVYGFGSLEVEQVETELEQMKEQGE